MEQSPLLLIDSIENNSKFSILKTADRIHVSQSKFLEYFPL